MIALYSIKLINSNRLDIGLSNDAHPVISYYDTNGNKLFDFVTNFDDLKKYFSVFSNNTLELSDDIYQDIRAGKVNNTRAKLKIDPIIDLNSSDKAHGELPAEKVSKVDNTEIKDNNDVKLDDNLTDIELSDKINSKPKPIFDSEFMSRLKKAKVKHVESTKDGFYKTEEPKVMPANSKPTISSLESKKSKISRLFDLYK